MPETTTRPLTEEERLKLSAGTPAPKGAPRRAALAFALAVPVAFVLHPIAHSVLPAELAHRSLAALAVSLGVGAVAGYFLAGRLTARLVPAGFQEWAAKRQEAVAADLAAGRVEVTRYLVRDAVKVDYGDGDSGWYLHLDDGKVLELDGDDALAEIEAGRFPSTDFELARAPQTGDVVSVTTHGRPIAPVAVRGPFTDEELKELDERPAEREETWEEVLAAARRNPYVPGPAGSATARPGSTPQQPPQPPPDAIRPR